MARNGFHSSGPKITTIISCYSPTNGNDETDLNTFYNELSSLIGSIHRHHVLIIGGDMNSQIGKNKNNEFCIHNSSNRNGEHLKDFSLENRLTCLNTKFQKSKGKLCIYTYQNNAQTQIDYILMNKNRINCALNCGAYSFWKSITLSQFCHSKDTPERTRK